MNEQISKLDNDVISEIEKQHLLISDARNELDEFAESLVIDIIESFPTNEESKENQFYKLPSIEEEEGDIIPEKECCLQRVRRCLKTKDFIKKLLVYFDLQYPNLKANFEYLKQRVDHFDRVKANDASIKQHNTDKNIPYEMGDVDCIFYDLDKQVELHLLERMYQDYKEFMRQQEREEIEKQEKDKGENEPKDKLLGDLPPLEDFDDLPEPPSLTKGTFDIETHINKEIEDGGDDLEFLELTDLSLKRSHI